MSLLTTTIVGSLIVIVAAGCLDAPAVGPAAPVHVNAPLPAQLADDTFELETRFSVGAAGMSVSDPEGVHYSMKPSRAANVSAVVAWVAGSPLETEERCMFHEATGSKMGEPLATVSGPTPLAAPIMPLRPAVDQVAVMCGVAGEPAAGAFLVVHVTLTYTLFPATGGD